MSDNQQISARSGFKDMGLVLDKLIVWIEARGLAGKNPLILAGALVVLSIATALPNYSHFGGAGDALWPAAMEWKFHHPLLPIPVKQVAAQVHAEKDLFASHLEKRSYRILVPLLAYTFGFELTTAQVIQQVLACLFLLLTLLILQKIFQDRLSALLAAAMIAVSFPGQWGFSDFVFFDGYAYFLIAFAVWTTSPWMVAGAVFAGGLSDERVIIATPLIWLCISIRDGCGKSGFTVKNLLWPQANHLGLAAGVILFLLARLLLALKWGTLYEASQICEWNTVKKCIHFLPSAILLGIKGGTLIFFAALALVIARRKFMLLALAVCATIPSVLTALMVVDLARSLYYAFPALFIAMSVLAQRCSADECRKILLCALLGCLLFQTCYVGPGNIHLLNY